MRKLTTEPARPFDLGEIYDLRERGRIQNMLIWQVDYPHTFDEDDDIVVTWSDRTGSDFQFAADCVFDRKPKLPYRGSFEGGSLRHIGDELFLDFCRIATSAGFKPTGGRVVRFTNDGGGRSMDFPLLLGGEGWPVYRTEAYRRRSWRPKIPTYTGEYGPNILRPERRHPLDDFEGFPMGMVRRR